MHSYIELATGEFVGVETVVVPPLTLANPTAGPQEHVLHDWVAVDPVDLAGGGQPAMTRVLTGDPPQNAAGLVVRDVCAAAQVKLLKSIDARLTPPPKPQPSGGTLMHR